MWCLINQSVDTLSMCLYYIFACFKAYECWHDNYFMYIYCMFLTIHWFLLSCVFVYICLCLYVSILYDCVLHDYHFSAWWLSTPNCYVQLWYIHVHNIDWFFCHDYLTHFVMYIHIIVHLIRLDTLIFFLFITLIIFSMLFIHLVYSSCLSCFLLAYV